MRISIEQPLCLNEKGKRANNEDAIYPAAELAGSNDTLFLVCDGIGGSSGGEMASNIVCHKIPEFFHNNIIKVSDRETIEKAIEYAEDAIDKYLEQNHSAHGMGTTLSLLHLHNGGVSIAWCGDSRIYQVREGKIIIKTSDHSYVNDMLKAGIITPEEAINHPKKNLITRAIQGKSVKRAKAEIIITCDVRVGDIFFLCTDGIIESFDDELLVRILTSVGSLSSKIEKIHQTCLEKSNDNFTCYLIRISCVQHESVDITPIPVAKPPNPFNPDS